MSLFRFSWYVMPRIVVVKVVSSEWTGDDSPAAMRL
jgi:hypothetical protein